MNYKTMIVLAGSIILGYSVQAEPQKEQKPEIEKIAQKVCPVMGGKINPNLYYEYKGQKIYVCCPGCINKIKKNPEKYLKKVKADIAKGEKDKVIEQTICQVLGGKINKKLYYEYKGRKIYVCCPGCISKIKQDPEKYLKKVQQAIADDKKKNAETKVQKKSEPKP